MSRSGWRRRSWPSPTTFAVSTFTGPAAVCSVLPSSATTKSPSVAQPGGAVHTGRSRRAHRFARRARGRDRRRDRCRIRRDRVGRRPRRRRGTVRRRARRAAAGRPGRCSTRWRPRRPALRSATQRRQPAAPSTPTDRSTTTTAPATRGSRATTRCRIDVHRAAGVDLDHEDLRVVAVRGVDRVDDQLGVRRVDEAVDLDDVDACRRARAPRRAGAARRRTARRAGPSTISDAAAEPSEVTAVGAPVGSGRWSWLTSAPPPGWSSSRARGVSARPPSPPRWPPRRRARA